MKHLSFKSDAKVLIDDATISSIGDALSTGWKRYVELFGEPPHGTKKQMRALVSLSGFREEKEDVG